MVLMCPARSSEFAPWDRDAGREQPVGDGLRVHVGEAVSVEVVDQRLLERLHELRERPTVVSIARAPRDPVADRPGERSEPERHLAGCGDHFAVAQGEGRLPLGACQAAASSSSSGQRGCRAKLLGDGVEVERRVEVVPAKDLQSRQVLPLLGPARSGRS